MGEENGVLIDNLSIALDSADEVVRLSGLKAFKKAFRTPTPFQSAIVELIQALKDENVYVRYHSAETLHDIGGAELAVEPLIEALKDKHEFVRRCAANSLGWRGNERAVEPLIEVLSDSDIGAAEYAGMALVIIGGVRVIDLLLRVLKDNDYRKNRHIVIRTLGDIGDNRAVEPLIEVFKVALKDDDGYIEIEIAKALGKIGDVRGAEPLREAIIDDELNRCFHLALKKIEDNNLEEE